MIVFRRHCGAGFPVGILQIPIYPIRYRSRNDMHVSSLPNAALSSVAEFLSKNITHWEDL